MEVYKINKIKRLSEKENDTRKKVAAYVRVSTRNENQLNSLDSQRKYYLNKITSRKDWSIVDIYADEGKSGGRVDKRKEFLRMLVDCERGKIDLILTKSISRFARNTLDTLKYVRKLKEMGIGIIFEEENINTMELQNELLLSIVSSVAQQEVINLSENVKYGIRQKMKTGEIVRNVKCLGYSYKKGKLLVNTKEAVIIRKIFDYYKSFKSIYKVGKALTEENIPSPSGNRVWSGSTIKYILRNEVYTGDLIQERFFKVSPLEGRYKKNEGECDKYIVRNNHEAIIDRNTFKEVKELMALNTKKYSHYNSLKGTSKISKKIRCGFCGSYMIKKRITNTNRYYHVCSKKLFHFNKYCLFSKYIKEENLLLAIDLMINKLKKITNKSADLQYLIKEVKNIDKKDYESINQRLIECIIVGDDYDPYAIIIILKNNGILSKKLTERVIELYNCRRLFDIYCDKDFYGVDESNNSTIINGFDILVYLDEVI